MITTGEQKSSPSAEAPAACPLAAHQQWRNVFIYGTNISLYYFIAPVGYVGILHAGLLKHLHYSDTVANLPTSVYQWTTPFPVLVAWYFPFVRMLKPLLILAYLTNATAAILVVAALQSGSAKAVLIALICHAGLLGVSTGVTATTQWEALGRGVAEFRRHKALAFAYGAGPILAVAGSFGSQLLLTGSLFGLVQMNRLPYPWDHVALFGASVPIMAVCALLASRWVIPLPAVELTRKPFAEEIVGGLREFFSYRPILLAAVAYVLVYSGSSPLFPNVSLYARDALGVEPKEYSGLQQALRFGFKAVSGFVLGWLVARFHPKAGLLMTTTLCLAGVLWALLVPGKWYLLSFGIMGAGELMGAYYHYYILGCSAKSRMRRNMAYTSMITVPVGFAAVMYGRISDLVGARYGSAVGLKASFCAAIAVIAVALLIVIRTLPSRPGPRATDTDDSDREPMSKEAGDGQPNHPGD